LSIGNYVPRKGHSKGEQAQVTSYYPPGDVRQLRALSEATRVPQSAYLREALEDLLKKYAAALRKAAK
jgi:hypothetical protein